MCFYYVLKSGPKNYVSFNTHKIFSGQKQNIVIIIAINYLHMKIIIPVN